MNQKDMIDRWKEVIVSKKNGGYSLKLFNEKLHTKIMRAPTEPI